MVEATGVEFPALLNVSSLLLLVCIGIREASAVSLLLLASVMIAFVLVLLLLVVSVLPVVVFQLLVFVSQPLLHAVSSPSLPVVS